MKFPFLYFLISLDPFLKGIIITSVRWSLQLLLAKWSKVQKKTNKQQQMMTNQVINLNKTDVCFLRLIDRSSAKTLISKCKEINALMLFVFHCIINLILTVTVLVALRTSFKYPTLSFYCQDGQKTGRIQTKRFCTILHRS